MDNDYIVKPGERALSVGQTGSGKSVFNIWLLQQLQDRPVIIMDTKIEPKFNKLPNVRIAEVWKDVKTLVKTARMQHENDPHIIDNVVFRPPLHEMHEPDILDNYLMEHYIHHQGLPIYMDEIYTFHENGRAGPGLIGLLTRGRSKGITTIMSTQRPAWLSRFALTESQKFFIFRLSHRDDKRNLAQIIPDFDKHYQETKLPEYHHWFYNVAKDTLIKVGPVPLVPGIDTGYTDGQVRPGTGRSWF